MNVLAFLSQNMKLWKTLNCTWICPKCEMLNFSDSYFDTQCNLENPNRFEPLVEKANKDPKRPYRETNRLL